MLRLALLLVLVGFLAHAFWKLVDGVVEGISGTGQSPARRIAMVRDPVCGTFVVPDRAVTLAEGRHMVHFCSTRCRDAYRSRTA